MQRRASGSGENVSQWKISYFEDYCVLTDINLIGTGRGPRGVSRSCQQKKKKGLLFVMIPGVR